MIWVGTCRLDLKSRPITEKWDPFFRHFYTRATNFKQNLPKISHYFPKMLRFQANLGNVGIRSVLDFTHAHLHKCMHFFLCAGKFSNLHAHCACIFLVTNFKMNRIRNSKKLLISTNFLGMKSLCFLYFAICVVFCLLRPSFVHVPTMLCKWIFWVACTCASNYCSQNRALYQIDEIGPIFLPIYENMTLVYTSFCTE